MLATGVANIRFCRVEHVDVAWRLELAVPEAMVQQA
jgi:hypothetical protein